jgi:hypothetical protein
MSDPEQHEPRADAASAQLEATGLERTAVAEHASAAVRLARFLVVIVGTAVALCLFLVVLASLLNTDRSPRVQLPIFGCFSLLLTPLLGLALSRRWTRFCRSRPFLSGFWCTCFSGIGLAIAFNLALHAKGDTRLEVFGGSFAIAIYGVLSGIFVGLIRAFLWTRNKCS